MNSISLAVLVFLVITIPGSAYSQAAPPPKPYEVPLHTTLKELNGDVAKDCIEVTANRCTKTVDMTVGRAAAIALATPLLDDRSESVERAVARGVLARQLLDSPTMVLNDAEVKMIEERAHKLTKQDGTAMFPSVTLAQMVTVLQQNFKPEEIK